MSSFYFKEGAQQIGDFRAGNGAIFKEEMLHTLRVLGDIPDSGKVKMFQKKKDVGQTPPSPPQTKLAGSCVTPHVRDAFKIKKHLHLIFCRRKLECLMR